MMRRISYFCVELSPKYYFRNVDRLLSVDVSRTSSSTNPNLTEVIENDFEEVEDIISAKDVESMCNKSRLKNYHRNILRDEVPQYDEVREYQTERKYIRKLFGKYGSASGVDPSVCWPTSQELALRKEYEMLSRPLSLQEMIAASVAKRNLEKEKIIRREEEIAMKLTKLEKWKEELNTRIKKRESEAIAAKEKKDRLIEEVRRYFGFKVDPRDEKFKEMLEKKEREEKKLAKEAKRKAREAKMLAVLATQAEGSTSQTPKGENTSNPSEQQNK